MNADSAATDPPKPTDSLDSCRIFQKSQLQVLKPSSSSSSSSSSMVKFPDFNQKYLKKLSGLSDVLCVTAQSNTVHAIVKKENTSIVYVQYDMFASKVVREKRIPVTLAAFLGQNLNSIALHVIDTSSGSSLAPATLTTTSASDPNTQQQQLQQQQAQIPLLTDGNGTLYPLLDLPGASHLRDPQWKQMFPLKCFANYSVRVRDSLLASSHQDNLANSKLHNISVIVTKVQPLIASVLRYDLKRVGKILRQLEAEMNNTGCCGSNSTAMDSTGSLPPPPTTSHKRIRRVLAERIDGNRNLIHAAVFACAPTSNKPLDALESYSGIISSFDLIKP